MISESGPLPVPGIMKFFPKIGYVFAVQTASGDQDYEIFPKKGYIFAVQTPLGAQDCVISLK